MGDIYDDVFGSPRDVPHQETFVGVINSEFKTRGICERCGQQWPCEVERLTHPKRWQEVAARPFRCPCGRTFRRAADLGQHKARNRAPHHDRRFLWEATDGER